MPSIFDLPGPVYEFYNNALKLSNFQNLMGKIFFSDGNVMWN